VLLDQPDEPLLESLVMRPLLVQHNAQLSHAFGAAYYLESADPGDVPVDGFRGQKRGT
jgi:hypothetical protein